jgi:hypothetical protein
MAVLGARALMDIAVPTGVDATMLERWRMEQGLSGTELIALAASTIGDANEMIAARWGGITYRTEMMSAMYRLGDGTRNMTPKAVDFTLPPPTHSDRIGHMLPRNDYTDLTAWAQLWLRRAPLELVRFDLEEKRDAWINRVDYEVIARILSDTEEPVGAGYSVGWAIGSGDNVNFIPPQHGAYVFDSTHNHYIRDNNAISAARALIAVKNAAKELSHHGHTGRKVLLVSETDLSNYTGMTGFVAFKPAEWVAVVGGSTAVNLATGEVQGVPGEILGYLSTDYGVVEIRYHERIPTTYFYMTKTYGVNNPRNGVAVREEPGIGFGLRVIPQIDRSLMPTIDSIKFEATHGIGVNDRTNGVVYQIASGGATFVNPTIS